MKRLILILTTGLMLTSSVVSAHPETAPKKKAANPLRCILGIFKKVPSVHADVRMFQ